MFPGFNTEIARENARYHIQTEVLGRREPAILTLVYKAGAIINRVKHNYLELLGSNASDEEIRLLAERQHRRVIEALQRGETDLGTVEATPEPAAPPPEPPQGEDESLEQLILKYLDARRASGPGQGSSAPGR